jgi:hypothetical protein
LPFKLGVVWKQKNVLCVKKTRQEIPGAKGDGIISHIAALACGDIIQKKEIKLIRQL